MGCADSVSEGRSVLSADVRTYNQPHGAVDSDKVLGQPRADATKRFASEKSEHAIH